MLPTRVADARWQSTGAPDARRRWRTTTGKTVAEADPEVSEAIDFARYYAAQAARARRAHRRARVEPLGPVVVAPPWNFPLAIPAGGVLAALAAGNAVILKPAPQSGAHRRALVGRAAAGTPASRRDVLQLVAVRRRRRRAPAHHPPRRRRRVLTGAYDTAQLFLGWRPDLRLHAETSGKNAIVSPRRPTSTCAVRDLVRSAFGHAGQKCSAASLAIVEARCTTTPRSCASSRDAAASLRVGRAARSGDRRSGR